MRRPVLLLAHVIACGTHTPPRPSPSAPELVERAREPASATTTSQNRAETASAELAPALEPATATEAEPARDADALASAPALPPFEIEAPYLPGRPTARPAGKTAASLFDEQLARWNAGGSSDSAQPSSRSDYHPAARVVVDVVAPRALAQHTAQSRFASPASLLAEARSHGYWSFRTCFEQGLRDNPELYGQVRARLRVSTSGRVLKARLISTDVASRPTVDCIVRAASSLTFRKAPARRVELELSVKLWPGDARLPPRGEGVEGTWDASATAAALDQSSAEIAQCCAEALSRDPKLWGRLAFTMQADALGHLLSVQESESHFPDRAASDCMRLSLLRAPALPTPSASRFTFAVRCGQPPASAPEGAPALATPD